jgi:hypothetical protein
MTPPGPSFAGGYSSGIAYSLDDSVTYDGVTYVYVAAWNGDGNYTPSTSPAQWSPLTTYSSGVAYSPGNTVVYNGTTYIYIAPYSASGNYTPYTSPAQWRTLVTETINPVGSTTLYTRGWTPNQYRLLLPNDCMQIGYRLHRVLDVVDSDEYGNAQINIWPSIRDVLTDGEAITLNNPQGLFRLATNKRTWSSDYTQLTNLSFQILEFR